MWEKACRFLTPTCRAQLVRAQPQPPWLMAFRASPRIFSSITARLRSSEPQAPPPWYLLPRAPCHSFYSVVGLPAAPPDAPSTPAWGLLPLPPAPLLLRRGCSHPPAGALPSLLLLRRSCSRPPARARPSLLLIRRVYKGSGHLDKMKQDSRVQFIHM